MDMPDSLLRRVKKVMIKRKMTFRALVIDALERTLEEPSKTFQLRDASVGSRTDRSEPLSVDEVNRSIDAQRAGAFRQ
jgi:hypothetical protein